MAQSSTQDNVEYKATPLNLPTSPQDCNFTPETDPQSPGIHTIMMHAFQPLTPAKRALFPALIASLALALPQSGSQGNGTPGAYTLLSPNTSTASTASTHLHPSLIHSSLPTFDSKVQVKNDQKEDLISTATIYSTIIVPTATELTTILTVATNINAPHAPASSLSTSTTTSSSSPSTSNCIVEGETDGICVTIVPIWHTDTLPPAAVKRQTTQTQTHSTPSYSYSSTSTASVTVIEMLTVIVAPHTTYTLTGFVPFSTTGTSSAPSPTTTATATSGITTSTSVACPSPSWLIDGHCVGNTPGWNPAPQNPTGMDGWDGRPRPPWETATTAV